MELSSGALWGIYFGVLIVFFLIFALFVALARKRYNTVGYGMAFLFASILAAIAVFVGAGWMGVNEALGSGEITSLSVLLVVAIIVVIIAIIYVFWAGEHRSFFGSCGPCGKPVCEKPCPKPCENPCPAPEPPCPKPCKIDCPCYTKEKYLVDDCGNRYLACRTTYDEKCQIKEVMVR
jgi:hypothetical protein